MNSRTLIELENYYLQKLKDIDDHRNKIQKQTNDIGNKEQKMNMIMKLDYLEKEIMTRD